MSFYDQMRKAEENINPENTPLGARVKTRKGKDMVAMIDGRWASVVGETDTDLIVDVLMVDPLAETHPYCEFGVYAIPRKEKHRIMIPKSFVDDVRDSCRGR